MKLKTRPKTSENIKKTTLRTIISFAMLTLLLITDIAIYAQSDPRIPAANNSLSAELAPAIGRIRNSSNQLVCTAWIAQGGVLITAGHCQINGDILEFNVPTSSGSCGQLNPADDEDQYIINNIVASNNNGGGNDWKIFEVEDNPITGHQPIEAQLKYISFVRKNVDNTSVPTIRYIDYGDDTNPNGPCTGGGDRSNSKSGTLQTYTGANVTAGASAVKLEVSQVTEYGASGGPMIDVSTGEAIALLNTNDVYSEGTTLHRSGLWNAFQAIQSTFTLSVTQKSEAGSVLIGSTISRWDVDNSEFDNFTLTGSSVNFGIAYEGNAEVFRGDQDIYNSPKEKFNEWDGFDDVKNHQVFQLQDQLYSSQFEKTYSDITVTTKFPEYNSANGSVEAYFIFLNVH